MGYSILAHGWLSVTNLEPCQTIMVERSAKIVNAF